MEGKEMPYSERIINEVSGRIRGTQGFSEREIQRFIDMGILVHSSTWIYDDWYYDEEIGIEVVRVFVVAPESGSLDLIIHDRRTRKEIPLPEHVTRQLVPEKEED